MSSQQNSSALAAASLFRVEGLVAVVTGGATGIGLMMTKALVENGASKVYILGRRLEKLKETAASISPNVIPLQCDVTSKSDLQQAVQQVEQQVGYVHLLVCNSGITGPSPGVQNKDDVTLDEFVDKNLALDFDEYTNTFAVNVTAVWFTAMAFLKLLDKGNKQGGLEQKAQVIVTSSLAAYNKKAPAGFAYGQSKAAATHAMKHLANQLPKWGIRANAILPGLFPSEMSAGVVDKFKTENGEYENVPSSVAPIKKLGDEKEMGGTILYLASRAGAYCNGEALLVDGGRLGNFPSTY